MTEPQLKAVEAEAGEKQPAMIAMYKIVPNLITLMALSAGVTSIQAAINADFDKAVHMLLIAAILDVLDGAAARLLKTSSEFGAQLDSLSDFLAFGVAPALILYEWTLNEAGRLGWMATVILPIGAALRLARFNVQAKLEDTRPAWQKKYFTGVPSPAGAGLALLPLFIWLQSLQILEEDVFTELRWATPLIALWTIIVAGLMVSRLPTFALKSVQIPARMAMPMMALVGLMAAALIHLPWLTLTAISAVYIASMPVIYRNYRKLEAKKTDNPEDLAHLVMGGDETASGIAAATPDLKP